MCLVIDTNLHKKIARSRKYAPRVAQRDIVVYKVLVTPKRRSGIDGGVKHFSPYQMMPYELGKEYKSVMGSSHRYVHAGLHSYRTRNACRRTTALSREVYPAIIPRGSLLFFGSGDTVVSTSLIVYADMAALEAVHGPVDSGVPRAQIAV